MPVNCAAFLLESISVDQAQGNNVAPRDALDHVLVIAGRVPKCVGELVGPAGLEPATKRL
jgi:hypothetical protein